MRGRIRIILDKGARSNLWSGPLIKALNIRDSSYNAPSLSQKIYIVHLNTDSEAAHRRFRERGSRCTGFNYGEAVKGSILNGSRAAVVKADGGAAGIKCQSYSSQQRSPHPVAEDTVYDQGFGEYAQPDAGVGDDLQPNASTTK